ncbi:conserved hypothetical protein [delta proteobacterium NaphS2]|nr:conserved hypothetical protein [delta proteobacterium NaphS2]
MAVRFLRFLENPKIGRFGLMNPVDDLRRQSNGHYFHKNIS